jgi:outer membrane protein TolC
VETRVFPPDTLLQSEANLRQKSTSRQEAERVRLGALFSLARVLGVAPEEFAAPPAPSQPLPEPPEEIEALDAEERRIVWIRRAFGRRADFLALERSEDPLRILARAAELDLKPRLDLAVGGGYAGLNEGNDPFAPLSRRLTGANGEVRLDLEWPMGNRYQRGLLRERRAALRQAEFFTAQGRIDISAQVAGALSEVRLRAETVRNAAATVGIARRAVAQEQRKLQTGESSVLDVINLENLLSSARLSEIDARAGYAVAAARLRFVLGEVFTAEGPDRSFQVHDLVTLPSHEP